MNFEVMVIQEFWSWDFRVSVWCCETFIIYIYWKVWQATWWTFCSLAWKVGNAHVFYDLKLASRTLRVNAWLGCRNLHVSEILHLCFIKYLTSEKLDFVSVFLSKMACGPCFNLFPSEDFFFFFGLLAFMQKKIVVYFNI